MAAANGYTKSIKLLLGVHSNLLNCRNKLKVHWFCPFLYSPNVQWYILHDQTLYQLETTNISSKCFIERNFMVPRFGIMLQTVC